METGSVLRLQRFSLHDGPGIRTTVFLKGCPARCPWCHNPESQAPGPELMLFPERCLRCGACATACSNGLDRSRCTACGACAEACPAGARQIVGRTATAAEVLEEASRDRVFFDESGGGVTFSGGEPLAQPAFLRELLLGARELGLSTAVDTCGFAPRETLLGLQPLVDLFLYDLKLLDEARHERLTGLPLSPILGNLEAVAAAGARVWLRVPVVPGLTDDEEALARAASLAARLRLARVELLPYHATGSGKLHRLGRESPLEGLVPPPAARLEALASVFRARGLETRLGGRP